MSENKPLRVLIVDDELLARQRIEDLLRKEAPVEIAGTADNGAAAVEAVRALAPDLVFLDVQMPQMTGLEVVESIGAERMPPVIFVTAFDKHALKAFEMAAVDYLVKPFDDERFEQAFRRARRLIELEEVGRMTRRLVSLFHEGGDTLKQPDATGQPDYLERVPVESRGQVRVVPVSSINHITASGPYAELHAGGKVHLVRERMQTLEERLDPAVFFRVHRSTIVRLEAIETLLRSSGGDYGVRLRDGTRLKVSRSRREELEQRLGIGGD